MSKKTSIGPVFSWKPREPHEFTIPGRLQNLEKLMLGESYKVNHMIQSVKEKAKNCRDATGMADALGEALDCIADQQERIINLREHLSKASALAMELTEKVESLTAEIDRLQNTKVEVGCVLPVSDEHWEDQVMKDPHSDPRT
jgi:chromosome segregation ATPase